MSPRVALFLCVSLLGACAIPPAPDSSTSDSLGDCSSSPLFAAIAARTQRVRGSIPSDRVVSWHNAASPDPLIGGRAMFGAVADLIEGAQHDVALQIWRWDPDSAPTTYVMDGLSRLQARRGADGADTPVVVRLLINRVVPQSVDLLTSIGKQLAALELDPTLVEVQLVDFLPTLVGASHAKSVIVDGQRAIVMGANLATGYASDPEWWDAGFVVEGEVAQGLFSDFAHTWGKGRAWLCGATVYRGVANSNDFPGPDPCFGDPPTATTLPATPAAQCLPMLVANRDENSALFPFENTATPQAQMFLAAMANARASVSIQTPNLNESAMKAAILETVRRDVPVQLLLSKKFEEAGESLPGRGGPNDATVDELYSALANLPDACARLQIRWYSVDGVRPVEGTPPPNSHVKYFAVDDQVAIVGSANHDVQSWRNSHEVNVAVDSAAITQSWSEGLFRPAWNRSIVVDQCRTAP